MGVVVAAMHLELEQRVALKFLLPHAVSHTEVSARFSREARAAAKIRCEHVARVIDVGTLPDGAPFMVMEYMQGEDLQQVLARVGPMRPEIAVDFVLQAAEAIAEAHALGIVHRDLKPANLFLAERPGGDPIVKVLDFGISKSTMGTTDAGLTKTSSTLGSPLYMSPEQMTSAKSVDSRSDIWALGVVLYELLTRQLPFPAETMPELVAAILQRPVDPVRSMRPDVHPALEAAIHRCLEKNPANRFSTVAELAAALAPFGLPQSSGSLERISRVLGATPAVLVPAPPGLAPSGPTQGFGTQSQLPPGSPGQTHAGWGDSSSQTTVTAPASRTGLFAALGAVFVSLLAVGGAAYWVHQQSPTTATVAAGSSSAPSPSSAPSAVPSAASAPDTSATPTPSATATPPPTDSAPAAHPAAPPAPPVAARPPPASAPPPPKVAPAAPAPPPAKPAGPSTPTCHTVSYFDSDGTKRFKQECK
jgi:serine/threonine-protein kinase